MTRSAAPDNNYIGVLNFKTSILALDIVKMFIFYDLSPVQNLWYIFGIYSTLRCDQTQRMVTGGLVTRFQSKFNRLHHVDSTDNHKQRDKEHYTQWGVVCNCHYRIKFTKGIKKYLFLVSETELKWSARVLNIRC